MSPTHEPKRMSLVRKFVTVGGATLGSRIFGFARETLMAAALGTGPMADVFYAAFRFPNLFRRLFAEGAFNAAFVPLFAKEIEANGTDGAKRFSEEVFGVLFSVLLLITIVMELAMPLLVRFVIAPGFADDPEKFSITIRMAAVMFPYLMCMSLTAMMSGMLNSLHHFFAAAIAPDLPQRGDDRGAVLCALYRRRSAGDRLVSLLGRSCRRRPAAGRRLCRRACGRHEHRLPLPEA